MTLGTRPVALAAAVLMTIAGSADAGLFCGAARYACCPPACAAPVASYTACKVERQVAYRTVYRTICEPQQYTAMRNRL